MQKGRMLALVTAASVLLGAVGVQAHAAGGESAAGNLPVRLRNGLLYVTRGTAAAAVAAAPNATGRSLYVVQFAGPVTVAYKTALTGLGLELGDYLPENAFLVRMDGAQRSAVAKLGFVRGVAPFSPANKLDPSLSGLGDQAQALVRVTAFTGSVNELAETLAALAVKPESIGPDTLTARVNGKQLNALVTSSDVVYVEPMGRNQLHNDRAAGVMGVAPVWRQGLDGTGQIVAITDTGLDTGKNDSSMHPDFQGQIKALIALGKPGDASDTLAHGTHVAGSLVGTGKASNGQYRGMAPGAKLVMQAVEDAKGGLGGIPADLSKLFQQAYDQGARIHSNSWGVPVEHGGAVYDAQAAAVDRFMWEHPDYTILFAAGNDGDHDQDGTTDYSTVTTPGTAKNAITVGASQNDRPDRKMGTDIGAMASFSSRGPTADGRVKPDVVAPGTWILSTRSSRADAKEFWATLDGSDRYGYMGGTSMATPLTAGATTLLRQYYVQKVGITPRADLLKATLINGAAAMNTSLSWKDDGWGRVDLTGSIYSRPFQFVNGEKALQTGDAATYSYGVRSGQPLKVTLAWTDYPASPSAQKTLVNDLDLVVHGPGGEVLGNQMVARGADHTNNVENVVIAAPAAGTYTVTVKGYNVPQGPQRFSLVVSGGVDSSAAQPAPPASSSPTRALQFTGTATQEGTVGRYYLDLPAGGTVSAELGLTSWGGMTVNAFDPNGAKVASGSSGLSFRAGAGGTYSIEVVNNYGWSDYALMVRFPPAAGTGVAVQNGTVAASGDRYRGYSVTLNRAGVMNAVLDFSDPRSDLDLYLADAKGNVVAKATSTNLDPETFSAKVAAGSYTLYVVADSGKADYRLTVLYPQ